MLTCVFWNLNKKPLEEVVCRLANRHEVDIFMFAEMKTSPTVMLEHLNRERTKFFYVPKLGCERIELFTRFNSRYIAPVYENDRMTIRHLTLPGLIEILIGVLHFPSKLFWNESSQAAECARLSHKIQEQELKIGHCRSILVGDFNMNPFEDGMVNANGLNSVMSRRVALRGSRVVQEEPYPFFYNPMWSFFGDLSQGPCGTFYYERAEHKVFYWNIFDQVLVRPALLEYFDSRSLQILATDGATSLVSGDGTPDNRIGSDHLPILFQLKF